MIFRRALAPALLALTTALAAPAWADEVVLVPGSTVQAAGSRVRGTIQSETPTEVTVDGRPIPVDQIASISYTGQPPGLSLAEARESAGALPEAAELFGKAADEASGKDLIARAARFDRARLLAEIALADPAQVAPAVQALEQFLRDHPNGRQRGPALERLARLRLQAGEFDRAGATLAELARIPWAADRAAVLQARVLARRGQHAQALDALDRFLKGADADSPGALEARLARAESLAGLKKFDEAEAAAQAVIDAAGPEDAAVQAPAHNALGDCLRAANKPKDALLAYLHTDILYASDKEQHARALAAISQLWRELNRADRADEALARLKQDYPRSPWLAAAEGKR